MGFYGTIPKPGMNRHKKRKNTHSGLLYIGLAFLAFIVIGLTVSVTIRACAHRVERPIGITDYEVEPQTRIPVQDITSVEDVPVTYTMPDSVIRICMPASLDGVSEQILYKTAYVVSYNEDTKIPNWVAWHLTADHTDGPYKRLNNFYEDEEVGFPRATTDDYRCSGWSRGHMCPAGDNKWNSRAMFDSFSLVNVCPQNANLNSGLWNSIEIDCRRWANRFGDIYIVCGPLFLKKEHETIGSNEVYVPDAFFKVVVCLNGTPKGWGVIVRNNAGEKKRDLYYNSIDQVERVTGIDFFPSLPDDIEDAMEAEFDMNLWN